MKSFIVVMLSIITIIAIPGETATLRLDKDLLGGGSKFLMLDRARQGTGNTADSIIGSSDSRSKRGVGGDGGMGSVKFLNKSGKRPARAPLYPIIGGDGSSGSDQFSTSTDVKMDKLSLSRKIPVDEKRSWFKYYGKPVYKTGSLNEPIDP